MSIKTKFIAYIVVSVVLSSIISLVFFFFELNNFTKEAFLDFNFRDIVIHSILVVGLIVVLVFLVSFLLIRRLARPIELFIKWTNEIAKGNLDYHYETKTGDEIGELARNFNQMVESLKKSRKELEEAKDILEIKVKARTRELEEQAEGLDEQVRERTKELQERINELERFHKLTVDREMKMIELKKQIQELKKENKILQQQEKSVLPTKNKKRQNKI